MKAQKDVGGILSEHALPARVKSGNLSPATMANLLGSEIGLVNDVGFGGSTDQLLADHPLALEPDVNVPSRPVNNDAAFQTSIAPLPFQHAAILQIPESLSPCNQLSPELVHAEGRYADPATVDPGNDLNQSEPYQSAKPVIRQGI
jgi:hypothetical protein